MEPITSADLERLAQLVEIEIADFLRLQKRATLRGRLLAVALCQGAVLHALDGCNGVKNFDVYVFFAKLSGLKGPYTRQARKRDYRHSKFGDTRVAMRDSRVGESTSSGAHSRLSKRRPCDGYCRLPGARGCLTQEWPKQHQVPLPAPTS